MPIRINGGVVSDISNIAIGDTDTYFKWVAPSTLQLIVNSGVAQQWVISNITSTDIGVPIGLSSLLHLTYS